MTQSALYPPDARGQKGDPVELARAALIGLGATDDLTTGDGDRGAVVIVRRDGGEVARLEFARDLDGGWLLETATLCAGLGFGDPTQPPTSPTP